VLSAYTKFIVALVGAVVVVLHNEGVEVAEDISEPVIALLTALGVYLFENR
jgi:hypothetical protein